MIRGTVLPCARCRSDTVSLVRQKDGYWSISCTGCPEPSVAVGMTRDAVRKIWNRRMRPGGWEQAEAEVLSIVEHWRREDRQKEKLGLKILDLKVNK